jgi:4-amino-4-deoxy-L-arabinose transferase-like glycosyltransferase
MPTVGGPSDPHWFVTIRSAIGTIPWLIVAVCAALCPLAFAWRTQTSLCAMVTVSLVLAALYLSIPRVIDRLASSMPAFRSRHALIGCIVLGCFLRLAWVGAIPPIQLSDFQQYLDSARELLAGNGYHGTAFGHKVIAYRAPGQSFLLFGAIAIFGDHVWTISLLNVALYVATAVILYKTILLVSTPARAVAANAMLAVWPSNVMMTGLANSESTSLVLWSALLLLVVRYMTSDTRWPSWIGAGIALGAGILVRPSKMMAALFLWIIGLASDMRRRASLALLLTMLAAALVVAPWSYRNYQVLGQVVLVSTNGGDNFYRANNPLATGGFMDAGERDLTYLLPDEVTWNDASMQAGLEWIAANPLDFMTLGLKKLLISLGSDNTGAYWSLLRAHGIDGSFYDAAVFLSDAWWFVLWALVAYTVWRERSFLVSSTTGQLLTSFAGYFFVIHAVYESQPRYHMPAVGVLLVLAAMCLARGAASPSEITASRH